MSATRRDTTLDATWQRAWTAPTFTTLTHAPQQMQQFFYVPEGAVPGWKPYIPGAFS